VGGGWGGVGGEEDGRRVSRQGRAGGWRVSKKRKKKAPLSLSLLWPLVSFFSHLLRRRDRVGGDHGARVRRRGAGRAGRAGERPMCGRWGLHKRAGARRAGGSRAGGGARQRGGGVQHGCGACEGFVCVLRRVCGARGSSKCECVSFFLLLLALKAPSAPPARVESKPAAKKRAKAHAETPAYHAYHPPPDHPLAWRRRPRPGRGGAPPWHAHGS